MAKYFIYAGIAVGVAALAGIMVFGTASQQDRIPDSAVPAPATLEGSFSSPSGLGAELNKEKWREDPFADEAAEVKSTRELGQHALELWSDLRLLGLLFFSFFIL